MILIYGAVNSFVEVLPYLGYLMLYLCVVVFGGFLFYMDWDRAAYKSKLEKYIMTGFYILVSLFSLLTYIEY